MLCILDAYYVHAYTARTCIAPVHLLSLSYCLRVLNFENFVYPSTTEHLVLCGHRSFHFISHPSRISALLRFRGGFGRSGRVCFWCERTRSGMRSLTATLIPITHIYHIADITPYDDDHASSWEHGRCVRVRGWAGLRHCKICRRCVFGGFGDSDLCSSDCSLSATECYRRTFDGRGTAS